MDRAAHRNGCAVDSPRSRVTTAAKVRNTRALRGVAGRPVQPRPTSQAAASTMNVDVQIAKAASLQYQAVLEECRAVLNEWRHLVRMQLVHSARGIQ